jgi:hypothetical protein
MGNQCIGKCNFHYFMSFLIYSLLSCVTIRSELAALSPKDGNTESNFLRVAAVSLRAMCAFAGVFFACILACYGILRHHGVSAEGALSRGLSGGRQANKALASCFGGKPMCLSWLPYVPTARCAVTACPRRELLV